MIQTRRAFLSNLLAVLAGGGLTVGGKKQLKRVVEESQGSQEHHPDSSATVPKQHTIEDAADFTIGGTLGFAVKKAVDKSIDLKHTEEVLSYVTRKLQNLKELDLPCIERTLREFVRKEGIPYREVDNNPDNPTTSIKNLLDAILIYADAQKPYLDELRKLRVALTQSLLEQLQHNGDIAKESIIQALGTKEFTEYISTLFINALKADGTGEQIFQDIVESIKGKDLLDDKGINALRQTVTDAFGSKSVLDALAYALSAVMIEYNMTDKLAKIYLRKLRGCLQDNDPDMAALKNLLVEALKSKFTPEDSPSASK